MRQFLGCALIAVAACGGRYHPERVGRAGVAVAAPGAPEEAAAGPPGAYYDDRRQVGAYDARGRVIAYLVEECHADPQRRERAVELERREREHRLAADAEQAARLEVDALQARVRVRAYLVALGAKERPPKPPPRPEVAGDPPYPGAEWAAGDWRWEDTEWIWIDGSWSDPAWLEAGGDGGGIGLGLGAGAEVVGSLVRDHRTQRDPIIRDHRAQQDPVIRDHRTQQDPIIRDHRERRSDPPLVIRDHRGGKGSEPPIVRDHRESRSEPRPSRSESHEARSSKSKKDDDDDRKTITRDHRR